MTDRNNSNNKKNAPRRLLPGSDDDSDDFLVPDFFSGRPIKVGLRHWGLKSSPSRRSRHDQRGGSKRRSKSCDPKASASPPVKRRSSSTERKTESTDDGKPAARFPVKTIEEKFMICPITLQYMVDPVTADDNVTYEREAIERHFKVKQDNGEEIKSPTLNTIMSSTELKPSYNVKSMIEDMVNSGCVDGPLADTWKETMAKKKKVEDLVKKAEDGNVMSMFSLARCYEQGKDGFKKDLPLACDWYTKAHRRGDIDATGALGELLAKNPELPEHGNCAMYLSLAAERGSRLAAARVGMALADGKYGMVINKTEAIYWLKKATRTFSFFYLNERDRSQALDKLYELELELAENRGASNGGA